MDPVPSPAFFDTQWLAIQRNMITHKLLQLYNRTPTAREVDVAELQEAWNKDNPRLIPLVVDGLDSERTEQALRGWLERLRTEEFVRIAGNHPWLTYIIGQQIMLPAYITPVDFYTPAGTTALAGTIAPAGTTAPAGIADSTSGIQYEIRSKL